MLGVLDQKKCLHIDMATSLLIASLSDALQALSHKQAERLYSKKMLTYGFCSLLILVT